MFRDSPLTLQCVGAFSSLLRHNEFGKPIRELIEDKRNRTILCKPNHLVESVDAPPVLIVKLRQIAFERSDKQEEILILKHLGKDLEIFFSAPCHDDDFTLLRLGYVAVSQPPGLAIANLLDAFTFKSLADDIRKAVGIVYQ